MTDSSLCAPGRWSYEHMISTAQSTLTPTLPRSCTHLVRSGPGQTLMRAYAQFLGQESLLPTHLQGVTPCEDRGDRDLSGNKVCVCVQREKSVRRNQMLNWERERAHGRQRLGSVVSGWTNHRQNPLLFRPLPLRIDIQGQWPQEECVRIPMVFCLSQSLSLSLSVLVWHLCVCLSCVLSEARELD